MRKCEEQQAQVINAAVPEHIPLFLKTEQIQEQITLFSYMQEIMSIINIYSYRLETQSVTPTGNTSKLQTYCLFTEIFSNKVSIDMMLHWQSKRIACLMLLFKFIKNNPTTCWDKICYVMTFKILHWDYCSHNYPSFHYSTNKLSNTKWKTILIESKQIKRRTTGIEIDCKNWISGNRDCMENKKSWKTLFFSSRTCPYSYHLGTGSGKRRFGFKAFAELEQDWQIERVTPAYAKVKKICANWKCHLCWRRQTLRKLLYIGKPGKGIICRLLSSDKGIRNKWNWFRI